MSAAVGADIASICRKCGDVWHVVVAKVGTSIAKVQCKECGGTHRYKDPAGKAKPAPTRRARATGTKKTTKKADTLPPSPTIEPDTTKPVRAYNAREEFSPGERIDHVKFGVGVVEQGADGKIRVFFDTGRKFLAQAKPASTLHKRSVRFDD